MLKKAYRRSWIAGLRRKNRESTSGLEPLTHSSPVRLLTTAGCLGYASSLPPPQRASDRPSGSRLAGRALPAHSGVTQCSENRIGKRNSSLGVFRRSCLFWLYCCHLSAVTVAEVCAVHVQCDLDRITSATRAGGVRRNRGRCPVPHPARRRIRRGRWTCRERLRTRRLLPWSLV